MVEKMTFVDIEKVDPPFDADRDIIDPDAIRELGESIRSQGLLQPILVRPLNGRYEVIAGHRRFLAHRLIGEVKIKALIREMTNDQVFEARMVENDQRIDLNPIERAKTYKRVKDLFGYSNRQVAQKVGRSPKSIDNSLMILELPEEFRKAIAQKRLTPYVALALIQIKDEGFRNMYFTSAIENGITREVADQWVNDWRKSQSGIAYEESGGVGVVCPVQESLPIFQACVACLGPKEISTLRALYVCPDCARQIRGALKLEK